jgi:hypothetical protein
MSLLTLLSVRKENIGLLNERVGGMDEIIIDFTNKVDHIAKNHLCTGAKTVKLLGAPNNVRYQHCLSNWLETAITPGIEELTPFLCLNNSLLRSTSSHAPFYPMGMETPLIVFILLAVLFV